jgi:hypothetical protein
MKNHDRARTSASGTGVPPVSDETEKTGGTPVPLCLPERGLPSVESAYPEPLPARVRLAVLAGELRKFVRLFVQIVGEPFLFIGTEFTAKLSAFGLEFFGSLDHRLIFGHIALFHCLISRLEVVYVLIISL